jgi:hypothetical protein
LLGLGSSSALLGLSLDRRLALAGGGTLLLIGTALALRHSRACELRPSARWRTPALMVATFALVYGLLGVLLPALAARQEDAVAAVSAPVQAAAAPLRRLTLSVEKMDCPPCAAHVRALLRRKPFVHAFVAEANIDQVTIDYDSHQISAQKLAALIPFSSGVTVVSDIALP